MEEARVFYENADEPKKLVIVKNSDHGFYEPDERKEMVKELIGWFEKYLK